MKHFVILDRHLSKLPEILREIRRTEDNVGYLKADIYTWLVADGRPEASTDSWVEQLGSEVLVLEVVPRDWAAGWADDETTKWLDRSWLRLRTYVVGPEAMERLETGRSSWIVAFEDPELKVGQEIGLAAFPNLPQASRYVVTGVDLVPLSEAVPGSDPDDVEGFWARVESVAPGSREANPQVYRVGVRPWSEEG